MFQLRHFRRCFVPSIGLYSILSKPSYLDGEKEAKVQEVEFSEENFAIIAGTASKSLATKISAQLGTKLSPTDISKFSDGETSISYRDSMRGKDVFVVQTCSAPVNETTMELLLAIGAAKRAGAASVTAVIPYFGYRLNRRGFPISSTHHSRFLWNAANDIAKMLLIVGADKVISVDLQRPGQNHEACFFKNALPAETVSTNDLFINFLVEFLDRDSSLIVLSPTTELVKKAKKYQNKLRKARPDLLVGCGAILRGDADAVAVNGTNLEIKGDVNGKSVVLIADYLDSAVPWSMICRRLIKEGAQRVIVCASHAWLDENSMKLIDLSPISNVIITDSIPLPDSYQSKKVIQLSLAPLLARIISSDFAHASNTEFNPDTEDDQFIPE